MLMFQFEFEFRVMIFLSFSQLEIEILINSEYRFVKIQIIQFPRDYDQEPTSTFCIYKNEKDPRDR